MENQEEQHTQAPLGETEQETKVTKSSRRRPLSKPIVDPGQLGITSKLRRPLDLSPVMRALDSAINLHSAINSSPGLRALDSAINSSPAMRALDSALRVSALIPSIVFPPPTHPKAREAEELGWIPHHTLPMELMEDKEGTDLDLAILEHYRNEWPAVREQVERETNAKLVDEHARETMKDALEAHEHGLYRLVPPALFATIERTVRVDLSKNTVQQGLDIKSKIIDGLDDLPISTIRDLSSETIQYEEFEHHLYKHINNESDRTQLSENPIPNRHAAIHGLVPYSSEKTSLNAIFMTDFAFHIVTEMKRQEIARAVQILNNYLLATEPSNESHPQSGGLRKAPEPI